MSGLQLHENPDHAELSRLAKEDPEAFERLRQELIDGIIESAPDVTRHRLEGLQFRIDYIHRRSKNALSATVKIYQMMWCSFLDLRQELNVYREPVAPKRQTARIIEFRPRKNLLA